MSPQQIAEIAASATPIYGPVANAASSLVIQAGNDAMIVFSRPHPLLLNGAFANLAMNETVAVIHMSMAGLKDLHLAVEENLEIYEKANGPIISDGVKQRAAAPKK